MKKILLIIAVLLNVTKVADLYAAKPVEIVVDKITYRLSGDEATVYSAERNLGYVRIPESIEYQEKLYDVTRIEVKAFYDNLMTSVFIPKTVTSCGQMAFSSRIKEVFIDDLEAWCKIVFEDFDSNPLWNGAKLNCDGEVIKDLVTPPNVNKINDNAFYGYKPLKSLELDHRVTSIGEYAFFNCSDLTSVKFSDALETIGEGAFYQTDLNSVVLPEWLQSIGQSAFALCKNLESVYIGKNVERIGCRAFADCEKLDNVWCLAITPPVLESQDGLSFNDSFAFVRSYPQGMTLHVPKGTKSDYAEAEGWSLFGKIIDDLDTSGIEIIENEQTEKISYLNMQGVQLAKPTQGLYIVRKGGTASKVWIR